MRKDILMVAAVAGALGSGCLVQIEHVRDARPHFEAARREAARLQGRRGPAHELNVLVYDAREEKLVRISVPMWLARKIESHVDWDKDVDLDWRNDDKERVRRSLRRHVNLKEIEKAGLGLLVEVDEDDGEQVLVWLR